MHFDVLTILPESCDSYLSTSLLARGQAKELINVDVHDLRNVAEDPHRTVDDRPYGGGAGMVMKVDIIAKAIKQLVPRPGKKTRIIALSPGGAVFNQRKAEEYARHYNRLVLLCGRYEGFDARVEHLVDEELSIGDYVLTGGELGALVVIDAVSRLVPGVVGKEESVAKESFGPDNLLEHPHYTRPETFTWKKKKYRVPNVLLSGDHAKIEQWRRAEALSKTKRIRPDLLK